MKADDIGWIVSPTRDAAWRRFGPFTVRCVRRLHGATDPFRRDRSACVSLGSDGEYVDIDITGDPSLDELKIEAVRAAVAWLDLLREEIVG